MSKARIEELKEKMKRNNESIQKLYEFYSFVSAKPESSVKPYVLSGIEHTITNVQTELKSHQMEWSIYTNK